MTKNRRLQREEAEKMVNLFVSGGPAKQTKPILLPPSPLLALEYPTALDSAPNLL